MLRLQNHRSQQTEPLPGFRRACQDKAKVAHVIRAFGVSSRYAHDFEQFEICAGSISPRDLLYLKQGNFLST